MLNLSRAVTVMLKGMPDVTLSRARAAHLIEVLKVAPGSEVRVGVLDGPVGVGAVTSIGHGTIELRCAFESGVPSRPRVDLLLALPRPKVLRRLDEYNINAYSLFQSEESLHTTLAWRLLQAV